MKHLVITILIILTPFSLFGEIQVESAIDWSTGHFSVLASRPLDQGMSPSDHPRALEKLEMELLPELMVELGRLAWDRDGLLADRMARNPELITSVENLANSLKREWSRLSSDRKSIEAMYSVELPDVLQIYFPPSAFQAGLESPIGWTPVPEDGWTGLVVYVPDGLPVRGTGITTNARTALFARILSANLEVLADPAAGTVRPFSYLPLSERERSELFAGRRPSQVIARELYGEYPCDIIISDEDTRRILASESGRKALQEGHIVILLDRSPQ